MPPRPRFGPEGPRRARLAAARSVASETRRGRKKTTGLGGAPKREPISRRRAAGALGAGMLSAALPRPQATAATIPTADAQPPMFIPERGARLRVLRPAKYIDPDE